MNAALKIPPVGMNHDWLGDPPTSPMGTEFIARVQPIDKERIILLAGQNEVPVEVVAGVLVDLAETALREWLEGSKKDPFRCLTDKGSTAKRMWRVINRDESEFTEEIGVVFSGETATHEIDAWQMRREISDWLGVLIHEGFILLEEGINLGRFISSAGVEKMLFSGAAYLAESARKPSNLDVPPAITRSYNLPMLHYSTGGFPWVKIRIMVPQSMKSSFLAFWETPRQYHSTRKGNEAFVKALMNLIPKKDDTIWHLPFNRPLCGLSNKGRLKKVQKLLKSDNLECVEFMIPEYLWFLIKDHADAQGITPEQRILVCIYYYAALWVKKYNKQKEHTSPSSFKNFERNLSKESKAAKKAAKQGVES